VGKLHRLKRRVEKSTLKRLGLKETELGELRHVESKAEARRRALRRYLVAIIQWDILEAVTAKATADIQEEEDRLFLKTIDAALAELQVTAEPTAEP
jgi:hypothetical protein